MKLSLAILASSAMMKLLLSLPFIPMGVNGNAGMFTYYETPLFYRIGNKGVIMATERAVGVGPSQWPNIFFPPVLVPTGNQCGGIGQTTGYGQSPVVIPQDVHDSCETNLNGYEFQAGTCSFDDMLFRVVNNGVIVNATEEAGCSFGRMKIPGRDTFFDILQFHIHTSSEHSVDGKYYQAELHMVHQEENQESFAVFGMFIDVAPDDQPHETFDIFLQGWEATARQTDEYCAVNPEGTKIWGANSALDSRQMKLSCPAVAEGIKKDNVKMDPNTGLPERKGLNIPENVSKMPNVYEDLPTPGYGIYSYRGGLTTPPCTEIVNWNLLDTPMYVSQAQMDRLYHLVLCFAEISTCRHATIANEEGKTNRPVQPLHGRKITHRCDVRSTTASSSSNGNTTEEEIIDEEFSNGQPIPDPIPPSFPVEERQHRRCIVGSDGGPLQMCWQGEYHSHFALLYPWFVMAIGLVSFYVLSRYVNWFPYTALMFFIGMVMGIVSVTHGYSDQLSASIRMWGEIDAETLLLAFLPGLLFKDAFGLNVFLFQKAFWQCVIMAFPMVLCGTCITALVGYYVLPYEWSWSLAFTFGAIMSATDPVAVSALLTEVGAPPRLKTHIAGESLLNDGSAIVFFFIFSSKFLYEFGIPGFGTDVDVATGFAMFFRMSLGAVGVGFLFSLCLIGIIYMLDRRFNHEESVVQVTASITTAYLCYYTAEAVFGMSGVIAVVTLGVTLKFWGESLFSDLVMMDKFWTLVEHILNSLIFTLGGNVWGRIISNADPEHIIAFEFKGKDWGYMILTWVLLLVIRYFLLAGFYPIISRVGLKSSWQEAIFMGWGGLRGAVGIALAVALDKEVQEETLRLDPRRRYTTQLFAISGGVAFMTLVVQGTVAGPLLRKLGLANVGDARKAVVARHEESVRMVMFEHLMKLLAQPRFSYVDWGHVRRHVSAFQKITISNVKYAVKMNKESTPVLDYVRPNLSTFKPFMSEDDFDDVIELSTMSAITKIRAVIGLAKTVAGTGTDDDLKSLGDDVSIDPEEVTELRKVFVEILQRNYEEQFDKGEIDVRDIPLVVTLKTSLEVMKKEVSQGNPLRDWEIISEMGDPSIFNHLKRLAKKSLNCRKKRKKKRGQQQQQQDKEVHDDFNKGGDYEIGVSMRSTGVTPEEEDQIINNFVHILAGFHQAHERAQRDFKLEFCNGKILSPAEMQVLDESTAQIEAANRDLKFFGEGEVERVFGHLLCQLLLAKGAEFIGELNNKGMLNEQETEHFFEHIQKDLDHILECQATFERMSRIKEHLCFMEDRGADETVDVSASKDLLGPSVRGRSSRCSSRDGSQNGCLHELVSSAIKMDGTVERVGSSVDSTGSRNESLIDNGNHRDVDAGAGVGLSVDIDVDVDEVERNLPVDTCIEHHV